MRQYFKELDFNRVERRFNGYKTIYWSPISPEESKNKGSYVFIRNDDGTTNQVMQGKSNNCLWWNEKEPLIKLIRENFVK